MTPTGAVTYCVNSLMCGNPINEGHSCLHCADCGAELLVQGKYRLIEILHKEAADPNKVVYRAIDNKNNNFVLKIIDYPKPELGKYLRREYEFLRRVGHPFPNICDDDFFQWMPDSNHDFFHVYVLVLPFIEGQDSADWIQEHGPITEAECIDWLKQILAYLEIFSDMSVLYRDMKPENIIVASDRKLQLIDFGSVREIDEEYLLAIDSDFKNVSKAKQGTRIFTFGYTPAEQLRGHAIPQSDFYALGRTVIYWLTGKHPVDLDRNDVQSWEFFCDISQSFKRFIDWLTAERAIDRPVSALAIRQYLDQQYFIDLERERYQRKTRLLFNPKTYTVIGVILGLIGIWFGVTQSLYSQAIEAFDRTQYSRAIDKFKQVLNLNPIHGGAFYYLGFNCQRQKDFDCAIENYKKSIQWSTNPASAQYQLGVLQEGQGDYRAARRYYQASLTSQANNPEALNRLARLDIQDGNLASAQKLVSAGLKCADDDDMIARLLNQQGRIYYQQQQWKKAEKILNKSAQLVDTAESVCLLAKIANKLDKPQHEIDGLWYTCFYADNEYTEGADYKEELLRKALPNLPF